ncbi:MAG: methionyl-tRNA formyltransferase [Chloroflexi bacterium]|jgi:methionyl-tRNA formyltransferase|nr:methionyl-tRNA formyltransferase [Chloroflexota bacterium]
MRIVFMGAADFSVPTLEWLIGSEHELIAIYTQPDRPAGRGRAPSPLVVKEVALEHGLKVVQPPSFKEPVVMESLSRLRPDVIVVAALGIILPPEVLALPPFGCINLHPSLLPRHRGPSPMQGAILAGDEWTGVSIMLMEEGVDSGPILSQRRVAIEPQDTTESLTKKLAPIAAQLLEETLPLWLSRSLAPQPQPEADATYTKLISKEEGEIDWHLSALEIWRRVRAFYPWPSCYTWWQGKMLKVLEAIALPGGGEPGRVSALAPDAGAALGVETGDGILGLLRVQLEGRKAMSAEEFSRGQRGFAGAILPSRR